MKNENDDFREFRHGWLTHLAEDIDRGSKHFWKKRGVDPDQTWRPGRGPKKPPIDLSELDDHGDPENN